MRISAPGCSAIRRERFGQELGVTMPASLSIGVHEESGTTAHLVLPPDSKLSEGDLQAVSGGALTWAAYRKPRATGDPAGPLSGPAGARSRRPRPRCGRTVEPRRAGPSTYYEPRR